MTDPKSVRDNLNDILLQKRIGMILNDHYASTDEEYTKAHEMAIIALLSLIKKAENEAVP